MLAIQVTQPGKEASGLDGNTVTQADGFDVGLFEFCFGGAIVFVNGN